MKLDPNKEHYDQEFGWVAHKRGGSDNTIDKILISRRLELDIIGGVTDDEASYNYDDWALCKLDNDYYLLSTSGCSCPSPTETWRTEKGPATLLEIRKHVVDGDYDGYTMPKRQLSDFVALLDKASEKESA